MHAASGRGKLPINSIFFPTEKCTSDRRFALNRQFCRNVAKNLTRSADFSFIPISHKHLTLRDMACAGLPV
jgi:hypothetical protein